MTQPLNNTQAKYLRSLAHSLKPVVFVGKNGLTDELLASLDAALDRHELIKVKFIEHKEKAQKDQLVGTICREMDSARAGLIGHTAIIYRPSRKKNRRRIQLP